MKYHVSMRIPAPAGTELESAPGGVAPVIGRVLERFHPETVHMATTERTLFMVVDLKTDADVVELMVSCAKLTGEYAKLTPVIAGKDFANVVGKAIPAAHKLIKG